MVDCRKNSCLWIFSVYLLYFVIFIFNPVYARKPFTRISFGAVIDADSAVLKTALNFAMEKQNNNSLSAIRIDKFEMQVDLSKGVDVTEDVCSLISRGVFLCYGVIDDNSIDTISSFSSSFSMPYITSSVPVDNPYNPTDLLLYMRPSYTQALIAVILNSKWEKVYYLYDNNEGLLRLHNLYDKVTSGGLAIDIESVRLTDVDDSFATLRYVRSQKNQADKLDDKYIILDMSNDDALRSILRQILLVGMNMGSYHYVIGGLVMDELDLADFQHGGVNITGFRAVISQTPEAKALQKDWASLNPNLYPGAGTDSKISLEIALTIDAISVMVNSISSMVHKNRQVFGNVWSRDRFTNAGREMQCFSDHESRWVHGINITNEIKQVSFQGLTGQVMFGDDGKRTDYSLDVMELSLNNEAKSIGTWSQSTGLTIKQDPTEQGETTKSSNNTYIITSILSSPYLMIKKEEDDGTPRVGNDRYEGYCADLADAVSERCQFDYILKLVEDGAYGSQVELGVWNGMVGELTTGMAHLAIAPLTISSQRERSIDFSKPFMDLGISIMIKKPEKQKPGVFSFMDPLSSQIWGFIIMAYLGVSVVLFLVSRFSPYEWQIEDSINGPSFTNDFTLLNSLWFALGAFMRQGCDVSPRSLSGRIVGSVWWFFTLILISSYTANLAAFLTVERMLTPIESADDLAKQTEIQYGTLSSGSTQDFFKNSNVQTYKKMWNFMSSAEPSVFENKTDYGVERVRNSKGKYAFLLESTMNEYYNQRKPCNTMKVGGNLDSKGYGIATPLGSPLRDCVNLAVLKLMENGDLQKLHKKWWYDKGECAGEADGGGSSQSALTLSNVAGIFYILIGGLGLSMVVSLAEFLYKSQVETRRQKKALANSFRNKARLSAKSALDHENGGYSYSAPSQVINYDNQLDYYDNAHTQV